VCGLMVLGPVVDDREFVRARLQVDRSGDRRGPRRVGFGGPR
jgi:hypothetical protein